MLYVRAAVNRPIVLRRCRTDLEGQAFDFSRESLTTTPLRIFINSNVFLYQRNQAQVKNLKTEQVSYTCYMLLFFVTYQIICLLTLPLLPIYLLLRKIKRKPVFGNLTERLGFVPKPSGHLPAIWFHAVSVGEVLSLESIITKIKEKRPRTICYLTVGTPTGKQIAREKLDCDYVSFLPYDFLPCTWLAYKRIKPQKLIIIEAEIWPNLLMIAHWKRVPLFLLNARVSKRSKKRYFALKRFLVPLLNLFQSIQTQSKHDKKEFELLGVKKEKLAVLGDIKAFNVFEKWKVSRRAAKRAAPTLLVGSLHPGELDIYLDLFQALKPKFPNLRMILAPRHFHWKQELIDKVKKSGCDSDITLILTLGQLFDLYQQATIYFLGGTFVPVGGHNLLEPAVWGIPTVIGPHHHNCREATRGLEACDALIRVANKKELLEISEKLLKDKKSLETMGKNASEWLAKQATQIEKKLNELDLI